MRNMILNDHKLRDKVILILALIMMSPAFLFAQYWQQEANYEMNIDMNVAQHRFDGQQKLMYKNNSPDTLYRAFYHLYWNAFQPGSMMDIRSSTIADPDQRVADRIGELSEEEIGYQRINSLTQDGESLEYEVVGTILEVELANPIPPNSSSVFQMEFETQVPVQIRRSGRDNAEGIDYSMSQWYPKMCQYDADGWHPNPYVGREFYGIWGDFDVIINIDKDYVVAGSGILQNPENTLPEHGYLSEGQESNYDGERKIKWHFKAENVHDFVWAADPDYRHEKFMSDAGVEMHFFYQPDTAYEAAWKALPSRMNEALSYANEHYGKYPFPIYSFIQGGDGGMEYPMATLITGDRSLSSLVGVSVHELMHSWYQMVLATDEARYAWMDEGFTTYTSVHIMNHLREEGLLPGDVIKDPMIRLIEGYANFQQSEYAEPLSIHADHFLTNVAYSVAAYTSGAVLLDQLGYIIGEEVRDKALLNYYNEWKFKHPDPDKFFKVMEDESGMVLDWYKQYMIYTTRTIDYSVDTISSTAEGARVTLSRLGMFPMPIDLVITDIRGDKHFYNIPLRLMRNHKPMPETGFGNDYMSAKVLEDWPWTNPDYSFITPFTVEEIKNIEIDPSGRMADTDRSNNILPRIKEEPEPVEEKQD